MGHALDNERERTVRIVAGFTTGLNVSPQSTPTCWVLPSPTSQALCLSNTPLDFSLWVKIHIERITLTFGGRGTKSHVLFLIRASYSSSMAIFQFGSRRAATGLWGNGEWDTVAAKAWLWYFFGLKTPIWLLLTIVGRGVGNNEWTCRKWVVILWLVI